MRCTDRKTCKMSPLWILKILFWATITSACGPPFIPAPPPQPTYYACQSVSNGPPCVGSTVTKCTCRNGQEVTSASCPNDNTYYGYPGSGGYSPCCYNNNYNGYVSCTCASGTWVPSMTYYQVAVNSNGQCSFAGGYYPYGRKRRNIRMLKFEIARLKKQNK